MKLTFANDKYPNIFEGMAPAIFENQYCLICQDALIREDKVASQKEEILTILVGHNMQGGFTANIGT